MRRKSDNELSVVCEYQLDRQRYSNLELLEAIVEDVYNPSGVLDSPIFSMLIAPDKHGTVAFLDWTEILFSLIGDPMLTIDFLSYLHQVEWQIYV